MRYNELTGRTPPLPVFEQAFALKDVRSKLMDRAYHINDHLLLLLAFASTQDRKHWQAELLGALHEIGRWRLALKGNPYVSAPLYLRYLWQGPFGGHETASIEQIIGQLMKAKPDLVRNSKPADQLASEMKAWHVEVAQKIETGSEPVDLVTGL